MSDAMPIRWRRSLLPAKPGLCGYVLTLWSGFSPTIYDRDNL